MPRAQKKAAKTTDARRGLVSVSVLLKTPEIEAMVEAYSRPVVLDATRTVIEDCRDQLEPGDKAPDTQTIIGAIQSHLVARSKDRLRPVVNATGIILHTGLGRAVLPQPAVKALAGLGSCCNLQIDMDTGLRGKRNSMSEALLTRITGAEATVIVNNNAAATFLILTCLCMGKEVIISRGQLIEVGGSFRLPDCITESGATMVEVGTTNKTHLHDYESALSENTGAILRANPSNYRVVGFTEAVPTTELVKLKQKRPVLVIDDLGCGALLDMAQYGFPHEPTVQESIAAGADLVCFSGDKLIGGPQSGIITGKKALIQKIKKHPITRMMRVGKLTDTALEHTLRMYLEPDTLIEKHPTLRMLTKDVSTLRRKAARMERRLKDGAKLKVCVREENSAMGGGSLPAVPIRTVVLAVTSSKHSADDLCQLLRENEPPVIARIKDNEVLLDMRTLLDGEDKAVVEALARIDHL